MGNITIRNLPDDVEARLRVRAAEHHCSVAEEICFILRNAVNGRQTASRNFVEFTRECFAPLGGVEIELPPRGPMRNPPGFS